METKLSTDQISALVTAMQTIKAIQDEIGPGVLTAEVFQNKAEYHVTEDLFAALFDDFEAFNEDAFNLERIETYVGGVRFYALVR